MILATRAMLKTRTSLMLLIVLVLGTYYPSIFLPLNSIDDPGLYAYLLNTDTFILKEIFHCPSGANYYRPLLTLSFYFDKYVWGLEESFMHLENVLLHLFNSLLVYGVVFRVIKLQGENSKLLPLVAAIFFALHPINTEAVNWISGRTDLIACFFILLTAFISLQQPTTIFVNFLGAICLLLACLAKETAIFYLPSALLLPFYFKVKKNGEIASFYRSLYEKIAYLFLFLMVGILYFSIRTNGFSQGNAGLSEVASHVSGEKADGIFTSLQLILKTTGFYVKKLLVPFPLNFGIINVSDWYILLGGIVFVLALWLFVNRTLVTYLFVCASAIGSSALMIPLIKQTWTPFAERYMYIPLAFFVAAVTLLIYSVAKRHERYHNVAFILCVIIAVIALYGTVNRTLLWQDNLALYQDTLKKSPGFVPAQNEIANALYARNKTEQAVAIIMSINLPSNLNNRQYGFISKSDAMKNQGDFPGALRYLESALKDPGKHELQIRQRIMKLYDLQLMSSQVDSAQIYPNLIVTLHRLYYLTNDPFYQYRLGQVYMFQGEREKARDAFQAVVSQAPHHVYYYLAAKRLHEKMSN